jgi:hypothetical protein
MVLLAEWGKISAGLTILLMRLDAQNHPNPTEFDNWAFRSDKCPYDKCKIQRMANFQEIEKFWSSGPTLSCFELMTLVIREKCKDSDYHG